MTITRAMIQDGASDRGGWNVAQIKLLGVEWPLQKGWLSSLIGKQISARDYERFLELKGFHRKKKIGAPKRPPKEHAELFDILQNQPLSERKQIIGAFCRAKSPEDFANELYNSNGRDLA